MISLEHFHMIDEGMLFGKNADINFIDAVSYAILALRSQEITVIQYLQEYNDRKYSHQYCQKRIIQEGFLTFDDFYYFWIILISLLLVSVLLYGGVLFWKIRKRVKVRTPKPKLTFTNFYTRRISDFTLTNYSQINLKLNKDVTKGLNSLAFDIEQTFVKQLNQVENKLFYEENLEEPKIRPVSAGMQRERRFSRVDSIYSNLSKLSFSKKLLTKDDISTPPHTPKMKEAKLRRGMNIQNRNEENKLQVILIFKQ